MASHADNSTASAEASKSIYLFFYRSLMDPDVLQIIARLPESPKLYPACIKGYEMKMWIGTYPTILPTTEDDAVIRGVCWKTTDRNHLDLLQSYETNAYKLARVTIDRESRRGHTDVVGFTFIWSGEGKDRDLKGGKFDLQYYQENVKMKQFGFMVYHLRQKEEDRKKELEECIRQDLLAEDVARMADRPCDAPASS